MRGATCLTRDEVAEAALAHTVRNPTEAAYARSDLFERRRRLMSSHIVVDCLGEIGPLCDWVGSELVREGFSQVSLLSSSASP